MKKSELKQIIKEEIDKVLSENNKSIIIDDEIINVGDKIRWLNTSLNKRRQGTIEDISNEGIFILGDDNKTKLHIRPPYIDKEIYKF